MYNKYNTRDQRDVDRKAGTTKQAIANQKNNFHCSQPKIG